MEDFCSNANDDLAKAPDLASKLTDECRKIDESLQDVHGKIAHTILEWTRRSQNIGDLLRQLALEMRTDLSHTISGRVPLPRAPPSLKLFNSVFVCRGWVFFI